jgi:two-component system, sensor histidine kinase and response regulator
MSRIASLKDKISELWVIVTGSSEHFILRARIFHSVCFIVAIALVYNIPFNYAIDLPEIGFESLVLLIIVCIVYYNSRVNNRVSVSINIGLLATHVAFAINYFINSGIHGPTDLFLLLSLVIIIAIAPVEHYKFWIPINLTTTLGLHLTEYYHPDLVPFTYTDRFNQFVDITSANIVVILLSFYCITYIRRQYEREKRSAELKSSAIEEQNIRILKQNLEFQRLNAEKNKLMSIIAHDLRSPLGSIQNSLEIITEYDLGSEDKQFIEKELLQTTKKTSAMLSKLLSWSKSQITGISVFPARHNLAKLLDNTLETEKSIAAQKKIELTSTIDPAIDIYADGDMMELVVRNLVGNAIKFTRSGGSIFISTEKKETECWLCIRDTGIGIPGAKQDEIFSLTAKSTYGTDNEKGLGLGLLLCKEFINAQSGNIWFETEPGIGTSFYISIPLFRDQTNEESLILGDESPFVQGLSETK